MVLVMLFCCTVLYCSAGAAVTNEDGSETLGTITSYANLEKEGHFALAYLKCRRQGVQVSGQAQRTGESGSRAWAVVRSRSRAVRGTRSGRCKEQGQGL